MGNQQSMEQNIKIDRKWGEERGTTRIVEKRPRFGRISIKEE